MKPQAGSRQFGYLAIFTSLWIIFQQAMALVLALILASSITYYKDEPATIAYITLTVMSLFLGLISAIFAVLNFTKDQASKWLGIVALCLNFFVLSISIMISIVAAVDTWS